MNRILFPEEIDYCQAHENPASLPAVRFSAKEAISKAFGAGQRLLEARGGTGGSHQLQLHANLCGRHGHLGQWSRSDELAKGRGVA